MMKHIIYLAMLLFVLSGCVEPFNPNTSHVDSMLVIEGIITSGTTQINLSRTVGLYDWLFEDMVNVDDALVYVECDDGSKSPITWSSGKGIYLIDTGELNVDAGYRLVVLHHEEEYHSSFITPAISPPLAVTFTVEHDVIHVCVSTYGSENQPGYYLWSYKEDWEVTAYVRGDFAIIDGDTVPNDIYSHNNRHYCWEKDSSKNLILGTTEKLSENSVIEKRINTFNRSDNRASMLYRIQVKQNTIHKEGYDFFYNLQKNVEQTGSIFGAIPSEVVGNIRCVSNPNLHVIGYVDVSTTSTDEQYLSYQYYDESAFVINASLCFDAAIEAPEIITDNLVLFQYRFREKLPPEIPPAVDTIFMYIEKNCVDCTLRTAGASKNRPIDWPNNHY